MEPFSFLAIVLVLVALAGRGIYRLYHSIVDDPGYKAPPQKFAPDGLPIGLPITLDYRWLRQVDDTNYAENPEDPPIYKYAYFFYNNWLDMELLYTASRCIYASSLEEARRLHFKCIDQFEAIGRYMAGMK